MKMASDMEAILVKLHFNIGSYKTRNTRTQQPLAHPSIVSLGNSIEVDNFSKLTKSLKNFQIDKPLGMWESECSQRHFLLNWNCKQNERTRLCHWMFAKPESSVRKKKDKKRKEKRLKLTQFDHYSTGKIRI